MSGCEQEQAHGGKFMMMVAHVALIPYWRYTCVTRMRQHYHWILIGS